MTITLTTFVIACVTSFAALVSGYLMGHEIGKQDGMDEMAREIDRYFKNERRGLK